MYKLNNINNVNNISDINDIELDIKNPIINSKVKKIIIYITGVIVYSVSLISSTFGIVDYMKPNNCSC